MKFEPGTATEYSDLGMILLMDICEKVSGLKFDKMVQNWVLKPIEMNNTFFNPDISKLMNIPPTEIDSVYRKKLLRELSMMKMPIIWEVFLGIRFIFKCI